MSGSDLANISFRNAGVAPELVVPAIEFSPYQILGGFRDINVVAQYNP